MVPEETITGLAVSAGGFILGLAGAFIMSRYAYRLGLIDLPNARSSHIVPTPRGGGAGILGAFILGASLLHLPTGIWCPGVLLAVLSFFDDRIELSPKMRLGFQFAAAIIVVAVIGVRNNNPSLSLFLKIFWPLFIVATTNFYNFMDGIDGIAGITGVVAFLLIVLFGHLSGALQSHLFLAFGLAMSCIGFLLFNFPKAKVFMGDVGSVLLGFIFAVFVFWLTERFTDFFCLVSFLLPFYADTMTTLYVRFQDGEKISQAHRRHLYQVLVNEFRYKHWQVSLGYGVTQLLFGLLMIWAWRTGIIWQVTVFSLFSVVFFICMLRVRKIVGATG